MAWQKTGDRLVSEERYTDQTGSKCRTDTRSKKLDPIFVSHRCTVHFVKSLQLLTNKCTYITFT